MKKKVSIYDIAKHLNVSAASVSFVLNGKADEKRISEELKNKIEEYAKSIDYQPNLVAKSLRTGKTKIIGMLIEDISDPFFSRISRGIEALAYKQGYKIFYSSTENDARKTKDLIKVLRERQVDGYIIAPPSGIEKDIQALIDDNVPFILFDRYFPELKTHTVIVDNFDGAYQAVQHLQHNGCTRIGFVTLESNQTQMRDRLSGYLEAITEKNQFQYVHKIPYNTLQETAVEKIKLFLLEYPELDGVLFATNYLAIGGLKAIADLQLRIPNDIAVVSFDDNNNFNLFTPSITAVAQPVQEISEEVVKQLMLCLLNEQECLKKLTVILPVSLIVRNSSVRKG